jgi:hypothetical protein
MSSNKALFWKFGLIKSLYNDDRDSNLYLKIFKVQIYEILRFGVFQFINFCKGEPIDIIINQ